MGIIRNTPSVAMLLDEFEKNNFAISVVELVKRLESSLNKTTVYRVLDRLEDDGIVHSFLDKNGLKWYAKCDGCSSSGHLDTHPHFQCIECGKVDCLTIKVSIPVIPNREVKVSQVLIQGKCETCNI